MNKKKENNRLTRKEGEPDDSLRKVQPKRRALASEKPLETSEHQECPPFLSFLLSVIFTNFEYRIERAFERPQTYILLGGHCLWIRCLNVMLLYSLIAPIVLFLRVSFRYLGGYFL